MDSQLLEKTLFPSRLDRFIIKVKKTLKPLYCQLYYCYFGVIAFIKNIFNEDKCGCKYTALGKLLCKKHVKDLNSMITGK